MRKNIYSMWTEKRVKDFLTMNPHFENFLEEGKGKYACTYIVAGIQVILFFTVSGQVECLLDRKPISDNVKQQVQAFSYFATKICNEILDGKRTRADKEFSR